ncbi:MAG: hypothetical protein CVU10_10820 [Bacteroidetes bacterium HGW-Bacteroidetes-5]|jgi:peroxiredoxin|nr:MAG: hypothetical protein CVU10_10820 [Bacteroidetes bacterium HGW-Bacteroidetes-5]
MIRNSIALILSLILVVSCTTKSHRAKVEGKVDGLANSEIVVKILNINVQNVLDTIKLDQKGEFRYNIKLTSASPEFYYLYYKDRKIASLILLPGEKVKLQTDTLGTNPIVEGSAESSLLISLEKKISQSQAKFDSLRVKMQEAVSANDAQKMTELNYALGSVYVKQKQDAIKYIYTNSGSITNMILLYHRFSSDVPLFADLRDVLLFRRVYDSLQVIYPGSKYVSRLMDEITVRERSEIINSKILDASQRGFPELSLPDTKANIRLLSDLSGKVILLSFWSVTDANQRMQTREYFDLYDKYNSKGFEIYQVSADTDKTAWARAVAEQQIPWISVCDGLGANSSAITTYNIQNLPANFLIDRSGSIVAKNIYGAALETKLASLLK